MRPLRYNSRKIIHLPSLLFIESCFIFVLSCAQGFYHFVIVSEKAVFPMNTRYELNMDVPPREAIRLMYVSKSRFGSDWNSVPHTHSCTEVFYCVDGRGQFNV